MLKPCPEDVQDVWPRYLLAIGIDAKVHVVRFVEDNCEAPTLSAWVLGWEVFTDGMRSRSSPASSR